MQTPEPMVPPRSSSDPYEGRPVPRPSRCPATGASASRGSPGLVLAISAFTDWYAGSQADGLTLSVTGWHTGALGKLVFFAGLATLILEALREAGIELPATVPESLVLIALGSLATIFVAHPRDLDPRHVLRHCRPRHRDLHQPHRRSRTDRRRATASSRRAVAVPMTAPPITSSGQCTPT